MSTVAFSAIVQSALEYAGYGWKVLPLRDGDKIPRIAEWQKNASGDEDTIVEWWGKWPKANLGVQLGERSGIIDIECDSEQAEQDLIALFGESPICPTFQAVRGKHRIFLYRGDLPSGACVHIGEIEVRTGNNDKGAQSVFPPSRHPSGATYRWLISPLEVDPPPLPDSVIAKLHNLAGESLAAEKERKSVDYYLKLLGGSPEGHRNDSMASIVGRLLRSQASLDDKEDITVLYETIKAVNERNNPPLDEEELRKTFVSILKREQTRRLTQETEQILAHNPEDGVKPRGGKLRDLRLVIVKSDPPRYELYAPQFSKAENGCLVLTAEQLCSSDAIRVQALKQADYPLSKGFRKYWDGELYKKLVFAAEFRDAPPEERRPAVVADRLLERLRRARSFILKDGSKPMPSGKPCFTQDGEAVFIFNTMLEELSQSVDKVTRYELSKVLQQIGARWVHHHGMRYKCLDRTALRELQRIASEEAGQVAHAPELL